MRRLIPARAGKTLSRKHGLLCTRAHPRAGGENFEGGELAACSGGSSPRGRGKPLLEMRELFGMGLIPARAGKTRMRTLSISPSRAHPRAGGENIRAAVSVVVEWGSSPRGRGKRGREACVAALGGLIPARAGKTASRRARIHQGRAHPRAGGENSYIPGGDTGVKGSSPRGRGKPGRANIAWPGHRLIPARAGKTPRSSCWPHRCRAHPRAGGENRARLGCPSTGAGSSPRGRGKHRRARRGPRLFRLIPARAGKTSPCLQ